MYSLHLNYYLLTISVTNTSKYIEVRQTVTHSHGKLKGKKHNTKQNTTKKSVCLLPFYNSDQKPRLRSLQARVCTENANVFFFFLYYRRLWKWGLANCLPNTFDGSAWFLHLTSCNFKYDNCKPLSKQQKLAFLMIILESGYMVHHQHTMSFLYDLNHTTQA